jgi:hypothetical protein
MDKERSCCDMIPECRHGLGGVGLAEPFVGKDRLTSFVAAYADAYLVARETSEELAFDP